MYIVGGHGWKPHTCSTYDMAKQVKRDLESRDPDFPLEIKQTEQPHRFTGDGPILGRYMTTFNLPGSKLTVRDEHIRTLRNQLDIGPAVRGGRVHYIKVLGAYSVACLSIHDYYELKEAVRVPRSQTAGAGVWEPEQLLLNL